MFRKLAIAAAALAVAALLLANPRPADAASVTANLAVSARVIAVCTIGDATLDFGDYDPAAVRDAQGQITVSCTNGSNFRLDLGTGQNANAGARRMAGPNSEFLTYELYSDAGRGTVWSTGLTGGVARNANLTTPGVSAYDFQVYGRIAAGQTVAAGNYSDTVTMTVEF